MYICFTLEPFMLWISTQTSIFIPQILPNLSNFLINVKNYNNKLANPIQVFCESNSNECEEILENYLDEKQSMIIIPTSFNSENFMNFYTMDIFNSKIFNFNLLYQKRISSNIKSLDICPYNFLNKYHSGAFVAIGTENGYVYLWQIEDNESIEYQSIYNQFENKVDLSLNESVMKLQLNKSFNNFFVNSLSWNKINKNLIIASSTNGFINQIDINAEKYQKIFQYNKFEPSYLKCNPFNKFEYITLMKDSSYFLADSRYNKKITFTESKKRLETVNWIFSENFFYEVDRKGLISLFDKRYAAKLEFSNPILKIDAISDHVTYSSLSNDYKKIALLNKKGLIVKWEISNYITSWKKKKIINSKKNTNKIAWSPLDFNQNMLITMDKNL